MEKNLITIGIPTLKDNAILWPISLGNLTEQVTVTVNAEAKGNLCSDRADAMICGLLLFAIKNGYDLVSELPISEELHYTLTQHLIPVFSKTAHAPRLNVALTTDRPPKGKFVATGISCGVDSLYTVATHTGFASSGNLTHLAFFDAGAFHRADGLDSPLKGVHLKMARRFAKENGFGMLEVSSDLPDFINRHDSKGYSHVMNHTFMMLHCVMSIAGCIDTYYYSAGLEYRDFDCKFDPSKDYDCAKYDLLTLMCASVNGIKFYSTGGEISRFGKIKSLVIFPPAFDYLNVCVNDGQNCGRCFKCVRTLLELDAAGSLDKFSKVFDIEEYRKNRNWYLEQLYVGALKGDLFMKELMPQFSKEMSLKLKISAVTKKLLSVIRNRVKIK